ncbi:PAS domain S-box protein [Magnetospira sp. QH-2]|uniref:sensor histidine kinase n=1 Tax=Magnetospira sp. (strain QH-2) TaxID=1288970 RepID=UPI0003E81C23|nr:PAS domain S-box protein [Magnetospira sp. QH-2]CCQ72656.1 Sensor protein, intramembrane-sensing histidine kinase [Magnetospira sp. QH-2]
MPKNTERQRISVLVAAMVTVALTVGMAALMILYDTSLDQQQQRLVEVAESRARMIEAIARRNLELTKNLAQDAEAAALNATLDQVTDAHSRFQGFGDTGEFVMAHRVDDQIVFVLRHRHFDLKHPKPVGFGAELAEPMRRALKGRSGTIIGPDYRGETVLAAHEPVRLFDLTFGIVTKIDLAEIRAPFIKAGLFLLGISLIVIILGSIVSVRVGQALVDTITRGAAQLSRAQRIGRMGSWVLDIKTDQLTLSEEAARILGLAPSMDAIHRQGLLDCLDPPDRDPVNKAVESIADGASYFAVEALLPLSDEERFVSIQGEATQDDWGRPFRINGVIQDITDRKRAEIQLLQVTEDLENLVQERTYELTKSEEKVRLIIDSAADGIITIDSRGIIQSLNEACEGIFGYPQEELMGQNVKVLAAGEHAVRHDEYLARYKETDEPHIIGIGREVTGRRKDGREFPMELAVSELRVEGVSMFTGIIRDISDRKAAELELVEAREKAEQASRAKSSFLSAVSHELRTPLNAILGYAQLLSGSKRDTLSEKQKAHVAEILKGGEHLMNLINAVLDLGQIEANKLSLSIEPILFRPMLTDCLSYMVPEAEKRQITLVDRTDSCEGLAVLADETKLRQVLLNLLSNAVKYNMETGQVIVDCRTDDNRTLHISVTDTGNGIARERMEALFEPFERLGAENSGISGTGIGLSICKRLVEAMDGRIGVESDLGHGATFWIKLPLAESETPPS